MLRIISMVIQVSLKYPQQIFPNARGVVPDEYPAQYPKNKTRHQVRSTPPSCYRNCLTIVDDISSKLICFFIYIYIYIAA